jgi:hypothetical protein
VDHGDGLAKFGTDAFGGARLVRIEVRESFDTDGIKQLDISAIQCDEERRLNTVWKEEN